MIAAMPSVRRDLKLLQSHGYPVKNLLSLIQNDDETDTLVYTSKAFQPRSDTFSEHYAFVGPSLHVPQPFKRDSRKTIYISMGTVNNRMPDFYQNCVEAFSDGTYRALLSVGDGTDIAALGHIVYIIRSGATKEETEGKYIGHTDVELSEEGRKMCIRDRVKIISSFRCLRIPLSMRPCR